MGWTRGAADDVSLSRQVAEVARLELRANRQPFPYVPVQMAASGHLGGVKLSWITCPGYWGSSMTIAESLMS